MATMSPFTLPNEGHFLLYGTAIAVFVCIAIYKLSIRTTNVPKIKGIPEIPGAVPFAGHLPFLGGSSGKSDPVVWTEWSKKYGWDIFQMRWGEERVVAVNSYEAIYEIWVTNSAATISRPIPYVFENYVGRGLGAAPWDESCKRQRGAAVKSVAQGTWKSYYPGLDRDTRLVVEQLKSEGRNGKEAIDLNRFVSLVAMDMGFLLSYGKTIHDLGGKSFADGFIESAGKITDVRVGSANWIDYIPLLRLLPSKTISRAVQGVRERQPYLDKLYGAMKGDAEAGKGLYCIGANLLSDKNSKLTNEDVKATCLSMLQGSSETLARTITNGLGVLCASEAGLKLQEEVYEAIIKRWGTPQEAFDHAFDDEDIPLVVAVYKEMLRHYCVVTFALPRTTVRDVKLKRGVVIPKGTTLYMNAEGASHDPKFFGVDADKFNPHRYMDPNSSLSTTTLPHLAYGAGSRICPAWQISNRILYALIIRLIVSFKFVASKDMPPEIDPKHNDAPGNLVSRLRPYKAFCIPREGA